MSRLPVPTPTIPPATDAAGDAGDARLVAPDGREERQRPAQPRQQHELEITFGPPRCYLDIELLSCADVCLRRQLDGLFVLECGAGAEVLYPHDLEALCRACADIAREYGWVEQRAGEEVV